ncbi:hypothetical protein Q1695_001781 [Nippostrongylus brasiliensis]|nr:hypothetical protein Q1695_001781 [Nippostrongylus brasiliensis]
MVMEDIDLGDRRGLIDLIYGPQKGEMSSTPSASSNQLAPLTVKEKKLKKEKSKVICSSSTAVLLFILAAAAVFLSGFASYWYTRQEYEMRMGGLHFTPQLRRNMSQITNGEELYEEEEPVDGPTSEELLLPTALEPTGYNMTLKTYLPGYVPLPEGKNYSIDGNIMITLNVKESTNRIVLNANGLSFPTDTNKVKILAKNDLKKFRRHSMNDSMETETEEPLLNAIELTTVRPAMIETGIKVSKIVHNQTLEKVTFFIDKSLEAGRSVTLQLPFTGRINGNLSGLHYSTYKTKDGQSRALAITAFKRDSARMFYPCFDESRFAAPLTLTILHPKGTTVRGSAKELVDAEETSDPMWVKTSLDTTSQLPTALMGFTLTDFVRVNSRPEAVNTTEFALNAAIKVCDVLQSYFSTPQRSEKIDIFAVPDLEENVVSGDGLVFVREDHILHDPKSDEISEKVRIVQTIANGISKQWFGNLLESSDPKLLWLKDAIAKYLEYYVVENFFNGAVPKNTYQTLDSVEEAFTEDARSSSHPIVLGEGISPEAIYQSDSITTDKGAAVLRMISKIIGEENFQRAIQNLLKEHANGNTKAGLWEALDGVRPANLKSWDGSKLNNSDFASKWIRQMGYPVVEVFRIDPRTVELTQRRFKLDHLSPEKAKFRNALYWYKWDIPIFHEINGKRQEMTWLHEAVRLPLNVTDTLLINTDSSGFYRVNYDEDGWVNIARQLREDHTKYSPDARARMISDALALAEAGQLPYETVFDLVAYLPKETDHVPWSSAIRGLENIYDRLSETDIEENAKSSIVEKMAAMFNGIDLDKLSYSDEKQFFESRTAPDIVRVYCKLSPDACTTKLKSQFENQLLSQCDANSIASECSRTSPSARAMVYCAGVASGGDMEFNRIRQLALKESTNNLIHKTEMPLLISAMNRQPVGAEIVSDFILDNWRDFVDKFAEDRSALSDVLRNALRLDSEREIKQARALKFQIKTLNICLGVPGAVEKSVFTLSLPRDRS